MHQDLQGIIYHDHAPKRTQDVETFARLLGRIRDAVVCFGCCPEIVD
jgi:hypothetical protein